MHKEVMRAIAGIDVFPVISLVLFVIVFTAAVIRALCLDRRLVERLSSLPLEDHRAFHPSTGSGCPELVEGHSPHCSEVFRGDQA